VVWAHPGWQTERLMCDGVAPLADPGRLILAQAHRSDDVLWTIEEALRSGAAPLVLAELPVLPGLTAVRRLQLAAEAGAEAARELGLLPPLGLLLTPGAGGAPGVESRWQMVPRHTADLARWQLARLRARNAPPADWWVGQDRRGFPLLLQPDPQPADRSVLNSA
jgi:protein ImuA